MTNLELLETWFRRIWAEQDLDAITEMMSQKAQVAGLAKVPQVGPDDFRGFAEALLKHITDVEVTIERHLQDGQWSSILMYVAARNIMTNEPVSFAGQAMVRIFDGKIIEAYNHVDFSTLFEQLGQLPPDSVARCLSGEILR